MHRPWPDERSTPALDISTPRFLLVILTFREVLGLLLRSPFRYTPLHLIL